MGDGVMIQLLLGDRCNALSSAYDAALSREHAAQRRVAKECPIEINQVSVITFNLVLVS